MVDGSRFLVLGSLLVLGCWSLCSGLRLSVLGCWLLVVGRWSLVVGLSVGGCWLLVVASWWLCLSFWSTFMCCSLFID